MSAEWNPQAAPEVRGIAPYLQVSDAEIGRAHV